MAKRDKSKDVMIQKQNEEMLRTQRMQETVRRQDEQRRFRDEMAKNADELGCLGAVSSVGSILNPAMLPVTLAVKGATVYAKAERAKQAKAAQEEAERQAKIKEQMQLLDQKTQRLYERSCRQRHHDEYYTFASA